MVDVVVVVVVVVVVEDVVNVVVGQGAASHSTTRLREGHCWAFLPVGVSMMMRVCVCTPVPHETLQLETVDHSLTLQSRLGTKKGRVRMFGKSGRLRRTI